MWEFPQQQHGQLWAEFLPGDAPELNPVEYLWSHWKQHELPNFCPTTFGQLSHYARRALGLDRGYSAHSIRATFITTALENGYSLEHVQRAAGHREPGTTNLYDRRGYNPEKSASFFATY